MIRYRILRKYNSRRTYYSIERMLCTQGGNTEWEVLDNRIYRSEALAQQALKVHRKYCIYLVEDA